MVCRLKEAGMVMRWLLVVASLWISSSGAHAQERDTRQGPSEAELQETVDAQVEKYQEAFQRWAMEARTRLRAAEESLLARRPKAKDFAVPIWEVAEGHPKSSAARTAMLWLYAHLEREEEKDRARALDLILTHHVAHESMAELCMHLSYEDGEGPILALRKFLKQSPREGVRGLACYGLGRVLARDRERLDEASVYLERARTEFGEVRWGIAGVVQAKKLSTKAARDLYELRHLQVGMKAPEIEGEDVDGVPLKLSDYAGKVVLLDFWGFW